MNNDLLINFMNSLKITYYELGKIQWRKNKLLN